MDVMTYVDVMDVILWIMMKVEKFRVNQNRKMHIEGQSEIK